MGDLVQPHAETILAWLPTVWRDSEGQALLRMQVWTSRREPNGSRFPAKRRGGRGQHTHDACVCAFSSNWPTEPP